MTDQIYTSRKLRRGFFGFRVERPQAGPGKVLVLTGGGAPIVLWPDQKPTAGEAAWNRYDTVTEIDTGKRDFTFTTPVTAKGGDVAFQLTFSGSYMVSDPVKVINERLLNPEPALRRVITESASRVTEQFDIEEVQGATKALRDMVDKGKYNEKLPFDLSTVNLKLDLDKKASDFMEKRREQRRSAELAAGSQQLTVAQGTADKLSRQVAHDMQGIQNLHELEMDKQRAAAQLDLDRQRAQNQLQLDKQKAENELAIQQMRIDVYRPLIQGGLWDLILLRLAENPKDVTGVSDLVVQLHARQLTADTAILEEILRGDRIDDRNVKDVTSDLLRRLRMGPGGIPALGAAPEPKQLGAGQPPQSLPAAANPDNSGGAPGAQKPEAS